MDDLKPAINSESLGRRKKSEKTPLDLARRPGPIYLRVLLLLVSGRKGLLFGQKDWFEKRDKQGGKQNWNVSKGVASHVIFICKYDAYVVRKNKTLSVKTSLCMISLAKNAYSLLVKRCLKLLLILRVSARGDDPG